MKEFYIAAINQKKDLYEVMSEFGIFDNPSNAQKYLKNHPDVEEVSEGLFRCRCNTDRVFVILPLHQSVLDRYFMKSEYLVTYYESRTPHARATRIRSRLPLDYDEEYYEDLRKRLDASEILSVILLNNEINEIDFDKSDDDR